MELQSVQDSAILKIGLNFNNFYSLNINVLTVKRLYFFMNPALTPRWDSVIEMLLK